MGDKMYTDNLVILSNLHQLVTEVILDLEQKEELPQLTDDVNLNEIINARFNKILTETTNNERAEA